MQSSEIIKVDENGKNLYKLTEIEKERMKQQNKSLIS